MSHVTAPVAFVSVTCAVAIGVANMLSISTAWRIARQHHPRFGLRLIASFIAHEQLAYIKTIPFLATILVTAEAIAIAWPSR